MRFVSSYNLTQKLAAGNHASVILLVRCIYPFIFGDDIKSLLQDSRILPLVSVR